ncbi:hypothetical protein TI03_02770 [Achromatium sp. WMS1]|nr:hypothetical protein TI03_02770 [Achromatium sp. WMS1]
MYPSTPKAGINIMPQLQSIIRFSSLLFIGFMFTSPAYSQNTQNVLTSPTLVPCAQQSLSSNITSGISDMLGSVDMNKLTAKPQKDLLTLAIGGLVGFATGSFLSGLGILNIEVLGLAVIPLASGLAGIYFANEGYFDNARNMIGW